MLRMTKHNQKYLPVHSKKNCVFFEEFVSFSKNFIVKESIQRDLVQRDITQTTLSKKI